MILNPFASVPDCPSGFVTTSVRWPVAAPARLNLQVILVELTRTTLVATMSGSQDFVSLTEAPVRKPVPARLVILTTVPFFALLDVILVILGAAEEIVNPFASVLSMPLFVTTTFQIPAVLPIKSNVQLI